MIQIQYSCFSLITSIFTSVDSGGKQLTFKGLEKTLLYVFSTKTLFTILFST